MSRKKAEGAAIRELERLIKLWKAPMGLQEWELNAKAAPKDSDKEAGTIYAETNANWTYLNATITIYPAWWRKPAKQREADVVHELAHCLTQQAWDTMQCLRQGRWYTKDDLREMIETLTCRITNVATRPK